MSEILKTIEAFAGRKILTIGDMIADIYLHGNIARISREAPVLVLEQAEEKIVAGGASNVTNNVASLGGASFAVGIIGDDSAGSGLVSVLKKSGVETKGLLADKTRPTIAKTRIIAGGRATVSQQIVRIDKESREPLSNETEKLLKERTSELLPKMQGVVLSDYGSGTITKAIGESVIAYCREHNLPSIVDSRYDIRRFKGADYIKQNDSELAAAMKCPHEDKELFSAAKALLTELDAKGVLMTRGEKGMMLFEKNGDVHDIPVSNKQEVYDVSGAGDTCVAAFILALTGGETPRLCAEISNVAAGIAVMKMGTATVSADELKASYKK